jgi:penicillin-binding protein-related factor A (putative recombinase)
MIENSENGFSRLIRDSVTESMHLVHVPDDIKRVLAIHPELGHLAEEKCYDMGMLYKGKYAAIELKNVKDALTFNINKLEKHQIKNLKQAVKCGGLGYCLVRFKLGLNPQGQKRLQTDKHAIDICYAIDIKWLSRQKETSFPIEVLQKECFEVPFTKSTKRYDLRVLWPAKR